MRAYRLSWWLTFWGLLTSLSLNWVLPALDHHAAEYNPFHTHQVVGATSAEREALLKIHAHGAGQPHDHPAHAPAHGPLAPQTDTPVLVSLPGPEGALSPAAHMAEVVAAPAATLPLPPLALWVAAGLLTLFCLQPLSRPPETPPRFAR